MTKREQLLREVDDKVNSLNDQVIVGVFDILEKDHIKHADHFKCDCDYCFTLRSYVYGKLYLHHCKKMIRDYDGSSLFDFMLDRNNRYNRAIFRAINDLGIQPFLIKRKVEDDSLFNLGDIDYSDVDRQIKAIKQKLRPLRAKAMIAKL